MRVAIFLMFTFLLCGCGDTQPNSVTTSSELKPVGTFIRYQTISSEQSVVITSTQTINVALHQTLPLIPVGTPLTLDKLPGANWGYLEWVIDSSGNINSLLCVVNP